MLEKMKNVNECHSFKFLRLSVCMKMYVINVLEIKIFNFFKESLFINFI